MFEVFSKIFWQLEPWFLLSFLFLLYINKYPMICILKYFFFVLEIHFYVITMHSACVLQWWMDASFAKHKDMRSHMVAIMTLEKCSMYTMYTMSTKQKINTKSSTEAELVGWTMV